MRKSWELGDEWLRYYAFFEVPSSCSLNIPLPKSGARSHIVDMLLDMGWDMVLFTRNIMSPRGVLPDVEFSDE
jgi:hypothetical protein